MNGTHHGQKLKKHIDEINAAERLKGNPKKILIGDLAEKMGIRPESLSALWRLPVWSAEMREAATKALSLPYDYFEEKPDSPPPATPENDALKEKLARAQAAIADLERIRDKYVKLLEEHTALLKSKKE